MSAAAGFVFAVPQVVLGVGSAPLVAGHSFVLPLPDYLSAGYLYLQNMKKE